MENLSLKHHLPDGLLAAYATGTLPEAFSLVVATHVSLCDDCRSAVASHEAVGGAILEDIDVAEVDRDALAATMARIKSYSAPAAKTPRSKGVSIFPAPLVHYVQGGPKDVRWRSVGAGVKQAILPCAQSNQKYVVDKFGHVGRPQAIQQSGVYGHDRFDALVPVRGIPELSVKRAQVNTGTRKVSAMR